LLKLAGRRFDRSAEGADP